MLAAALVVVVTTGCGAPGAGSTAAPPAPVTTGQVLATAPASGLVATTTALTRSTLTGETTLDLAPALAEAGFRGGRQRSFQGQSRDLTLVVSRELVFADPTGASRYLAWLHEHAAQLFGLTTRSAAVDVGGRSGWVFSAPQCACPGAQPKVVGVVADGSSLQWLSINGPQADSARLHSLLAAPRTST